MDIKNFFDISRLDTYQKIALFMCLLFLVSLLILSHFHEMGGFGVETDFYGSYAKNVDNILSGGHYYDEDHGPGYIFVLILFYLIIGDVFVAGKILTIVSSVLFIYFSFKVLNDLFNSKLALFTALLLLIIISPYSILAATDMFFAFLIALSTYLIFRKGKITHSNLFWGGLIAGYAFMTRINAIILPIAIIFSLVIINPQSWNWAQRLKGILIFGGTMLVASSPWFIMNMIYYGKPFVSEAHQTIGASFLGHGDPVSGNIAWGAEKEAIAKQYDSLFSLILGNFKKFLIFFLWNILLYFKQLLLQLLRFPAYLFLAPGAVLLFSKINKIQLSYFSIPVFGFLIYCIVSFIPRFYIYILVYFLFLIVYFLFYQIPGEDKSFSIRFSTINKVLYGIMVLFMLSASAKAVKKNITNEPVHLKKIAVILRQEADSTDVLLARKPHLAYLSKLNRALLPDVDSIDELLKDAKEKKASFIYYGQIEAELRPGLKVLQHPDKLPPTFKLLYHQEQPEVFLYKIVPDSTK